jgi:hypothetical protein
MRDIEFRKSRLFQNHGFDKIPVIMSPKPLITIEVRIKKSVVGMEMTPAMISTQIDSNRETVYKYEIQTKPSLDDIWSDFYSMIDLFISSVSRIRRIDDMVIPLLKLKKNTLMQVDKNKQPRIVALNKLISGVIESMRVQPDAKMLNLIAYQPYLEMNFDSLMLDLKMKTYAE